MKIILALIITMSSLVAGEVPKLTKQNYHEGIASSKYVVVDVFADWCGPCKRLAPILEALSEESGERVKFRKLEADEENQELLSELNVRALPTLIFYKDGKEVSRSSGFKDKEALKSVIEQTFNQ